MVALLEPTTYLFNEYLIPIILCKGSPRGAFVVSTRILKVTKKSIMANIKLTWNLKKIMQNKEVSIPKLAAGLNTLGHTISEAHVARIANQAPKRVDLDLIGNLCEILECKTTDLLTVNNRPDIYFDGQINDFVCQNKECCLEIRLERTAGDAFSVITSCPGDAIPVIELVKAFQKDRNSFAVTIVKTIGRDSISISKDGLAAGNPYFDMSSVDQGFVSLLFLKKRNLLNSINSMHGFTLLGLLNKFAPEGLNKFSETPWIPIEDIYTIFEQSIEMYPGNLNRFVVQKAVLAVNGADLGFQIAAEKQVVHKKIKYFRFVAEG